MHFGQAGSLLRFSLPQHVHSFTFILVIFFAVSVALQNLSESVPPVYKRIEAKGYRETQEILIRTPNARNSN